MRVPFPIFCVILASASALLINLLVPFPILLVVDEKNALWKDAVGELRRNACVAGM